MTICGKNQLFYRVLFGRQFKITKLFQLKRQRHFSPVAHVLVTPDQSSMSKLLLIEPFYTGSHKQLVDLLHGKIADSDLVTLPGKKWHWRARTSALLLSQQIPADHQYR